MMDKDKKESMPQPPAKDVKENEEKVTYIPNANAAGDGALERSQENNIGARDPEDDEERSRKSIY